MVRFRNVLGQVNDNISFFGVDRQGPRLSNIRGPIKGKFFTVMPAKIHIEFADPDGISPWHKVRVLFHLLLGSLIDEG
jgi:hypothetical protein